MLTIYYLQVGEKVYYTDNPNNEFRSRNYTDLYANRILIDGEEPKLSFHPYWLISDTIPYKIEKKENVCIDRRYVLNDPDTFPNLKQWYDYNDVCLGFDDDGYRIFKEDFGKISSLYEFVEQREDQINSIPFELINLGKVDVVYSDSPFFYKITKVLEISEKSVKYPVLSQITTPSILLNQTPCSLTSKQSYDIIRSYVKENINLSVARITSDYDFCFNVEKLIELYEPESYTVDINATLCGKKRKPKYETRFRKTRSVKIFEMTHDERNYKGYTAIEGFSAENEPELAKKIENFLITLMEKINKPLVDCPHCKGYGVIGIDEQ